LRGFCKRRGGHWLQNQLDSGVLSALAPLTTQIKSTAKVTPSAVDQNDPFDNRPKRTRSKLPSMITAAKLTPDHGT
jgi:hypothetical protein